MSRSALRVSSRLANGKDNSCDRATRSISFPVVEQSKPTGQSRSTTGMPTDQNLPPRPALPGAQAHRCPGAYCPNSHFLTCSATARSRWSLIRSRWTLAMSPREWPMMWSTATWSIDSPPLQRGLAVWVVGHFAEVVGPAADLFAPSAGGVNPEREVGTGLPGLLFRPLRGTMGHGRHLLERRRTEPSGVHPPEGSFRGDRVS